MRKLGRKERVGEFARGQGGRVAWAQMKHLGLADSTISRWAAERYLVVVAPRVYAVGHVAPNRESDLWTAVLYAGPGAMVSHATAAHLHELIKYPPPVIEVSTPRPSVRSIPGEIRVYARRDRMRVLGPKGIPITAVPDTLLDLAATQELRLVRRALAQLDYRKQLSIREIEAACCQGRKGSRALHEALANHQPQLALTNGRLEEDFLDFCERWAVPIPRMNVRVHGILVDAYWPEHGLIVELDGVTNHSSIAQLRRDKRSDLLLRSHGLSVVRYDWALLHEEPAAMHADLTGHLR